MPKSIVETQIGLAQIKTMFEIKVKKETRKIAGCTCVDGKILADSFVAVRRQGNVLELFIRIDNKRKIENGEFEETQRKCQLYKFRRRVWYNIGRFRSNLILIT